MAVEKRQQFIKEDFMLWLLAAVLSFFWLFGLVIGSLGIFVHLILLVALFIVTICLIDDYFHPNVSHF